MKLIASLFFCFLVFHSAWSIDYKREGVKYLQNSQFDSANFYFNLQIEYCKINYCEDTSLANLYLLQGKSYQFSQKYDSALINFKKSEVLFNKTDNINGIAATYIRLGDYYRHMGDLERSFGYFNKIKTSRQFNQISNQNLANYYNRYAALIGQTSGDLKLIISYSTEAIEYAREFNDKNIEASSYNEIGYAYSNQNDFNCISYFTSALELYETLKSRRDQVTVIVNIARFYHNQRHFKESIFYCDKGIQLIEDTEWYNMKRELYFFKFICLQNTSKYKEALPNLESAHYFEMKNNELNWQKSLKEIETKFEVDKKDKQILMEQEKSKFIWQESIQKEQEKNSIIFISFLLAITLSIAIFSYIRIKKTNKLLNNTLNQKDVLLQEVHHRVKNNLTLLNSLLYLRAKSSQDSNVKLILNECQSRVQSMAIVHQNLYDVSDLTKVNFQEFLEQLVKESHALFGDKNKELNLKIDTKNISFDMGFAIFLGLILNEFITNTYKYGLSTKRNEENYIQIELFNKTSEYSLTYKDSGNGLPINFDIKSSGGFGFKLVNILLTQIDATLDYKKNNNTFTIRFIKQ